MDGAIVVNDSVTKILKANVHLNQAIQYQLRKQEQGTEQQSERHFNRFDSLAVSEETSLIKVFGFQIIELEESAAILARVNESLQSVDRMRRRFDDAVTNLGEQRLKTL